MKTIYFMILPIIVRLYLSSIICSFIIIAVVINMFRLPDFIAGENIMCNGLKLLERLDQAILEVIDKPEKTQQTTAIGTLF